MAKNENTKKGAAEDVVVKGQPLQSGDNFTDQESAFSNVIQTFKGGERKLAGARASELIYGAGKKPNQKIQDQLLEEIPELKDYISAPVSGLVVDTVQDTGYTPDETPSNLSGEQAKEEQDAIDKVLQPGRDARNKHREADDDTVGDTKLNPSEDKGLDVNDRYGKK